MKNGFKELEVWKRSHRLTLEIYSLTKDFPKEEKYRLTNQICRVASAIPTNIVEGRGRYNKKEFKQFIYSTGSLEEIKHHLILAKDLEYLSIMS